MATTTVSIIGQEMTSREKRDETPQESEIFIVRCDMKGVRAMARVEPLIGVKIDKNDNNYVNRKQYEELLRLGIPHEVVSAPSSYKPPVVRIKRE
jgi:hypothetical protein